MDVSAAQQASFCSHSVVRAVQLTLVRVGVAADGNAAAAGAGIQ